MADQPSNISELAAELRQLARDSGQVVIDLAQGAPTLPPPATARTALAAASESTGYPATVGTSQLRQVYRDWLARNHGAHVPDDGVIPTIGSKEFIAGLPAALGLSDKSLVVTPALAYPTYRVGAQAVGARVHAADDLFSVGPETPDLLWLNTPSNPTGQVLGVEHLRKVVSWARRRGTLVVSDECYLELGPAGTPSILTEDVCDGDLTGILAAHSLSKSSALASYRIGFVAGDPQVLARLTHWRRNHGLLVPGPMQAVATAVLQDDEHMQSARQYYAERRLELSAALEAAGLGVPADQAGLFVWAHSSEQVGSVAWFAERGVVVAPGEFYGPIGAGWVRLSLTAAEPDFLDLLGRMSRI